MVDVIGPAHGGSHGQLVSIVRSYPFHAVRFVALGSGESVENAHPVTF